MFKADIPKDLIVFKYQFIDYLRATFDPLKIYGNTKNTNDTIEAVKRIFLRNGWEGDGDVRLIWIPPFLDLSSDDNYGDFIWHVKQSNDGISFIGFHKIIQSAKLLDQNQIFKVEGKDVKPISLAYYAKKGLFRQLKTKKALLLEVADLSVANTFSNNLMNLTLGYIQSDIISEFIDFIDECYLQFLIHVLSHNNPDSIKLRSMSARINLDQISESAQEMGGSGDHWLTIHQIISSIWKDFKFMPFKDKFKEIMNCVGYKHDNREITDINKHVVIRNCIQHHRCQLDADVLKTFGQDKIRILNENGKYNIVKKWDLIILSIAEVNYLLTIVGNFTNQYASYIKERIKDRSFLHNFKEDEIENI